MTVRLDELQTPAFIVDLDRARANATAMRDKARISGVLLRPHVKTHKTIEGARLQLGGEAGPITVSTLAEAEFFAAHGFDDITYAVPIAPAKLDRVADLSRRLKRCSILLDGFEALAAVEAFAHSKSLRFSVFLKVDCGDHRAGVLPDDAAAIELVRSLARSEAIRFEGLLTHAGHSYRATGPDQILRTAREEAAAVAALAETARGEGISVAVRSIGSTPTASVVDRFPKVEEVRPGNYLFFDAFQAAIGSCRTEDVAVSVLATVIGRYPGQRRVVIDAGALALSKDLGAEHVTGRREYGVVCDEHLRILPHLRLRGLSQEHGEIHCGEKRVEVPAVGARLRILPNHSCLTAAMFDRYWIVSGVEVVGEWAPARGW
ncbi:MAG TPA: alanine racemase [Thermoanaerobaculia bacterium]|nr:alanine racemase [Thermoanaerobaculia bacterium]